MIIIAFIVGMLLGVMLTTVGMPKPVEQQKLDAVSKRIRRVTASLKAAIDSTKEN